MRVLVTGAGGNLGEETTKVLTEAGHEVVAVDQKFRKDLPVELHLGDLTDPKLAYNLGKGCDAVVHLANNTTQFARPMAQQVLSENVSMTANVFRASLELGMKRFLFASSIQAFRGGDHRVDDRELPLPYLPLDGDVPSNPQNNFYALSKEVGERMLQMMAAESEELCCTALRFPLLISERWRKHWSRPWRRRRGGLPTHEAFSHLSMLDAARLVQAVLEREKPGYHCYFPAQTLALKDWSVDKMVAEFYPDVPLKVPVNEMKSLIDISALERNLKWRPEQEPLSIEVD